MSNLQEKKEEYILSLDNSGQLTKIDIIEQNLNAIDFGYELCQKEYEEKLRWIPIEERLPEIGIWIIIQLKNQSLKNKYVTMLPKNDFEINFIKENVISWRSFL